MLLPGLCQAEATTFEAGTLSPYARATRSPVLTWRVGLDREREFPRYRADGRRVSSPLSPYTLATRYPLSSYARATLSPYELATRAPLSPYTLATRSPLSLAARYAISATPLSSTCLLRDHQSSDRYSAISTDVYYAATRQVLTWGMGRLGRLGFGNELVSRLWAYA
eukprot:3935739-Rhodomonas_salina.3